MTYADDEAVIDDLKERFKINYLAKKRFIESEMERRHWKMTYRQASARIDHWLDRNDAHQFPAAALHNAIRALGVDDFLDPFHATGAVAGRERRIKELRESELTAMKKVEPVASRFGRVA